VRGLLSPRSKFYRRSADPDEHSCSSAAAFRAFFAPRFSLSLSHLRSLLSSFRAGSLFRVASHAYRVHVRPTPRGRGMAGGRGSVALEGSLKGQRSRAALPDSSSCVVPSAIRRHGGFKFPAIPKMLMRHRRARPRFFRRLWVRNNRRASCPRRIEIAESTGRGFTRLVSNSRGFSPQHPSFPSFLVLVADYTFPSRRGGCRYYERVRDIPILLINDVYTRCRRRIFHGAREIFDRPRTHGGIVNGRCNWKILGALPFNSAAVFARDTRRSELSQESCFYIAAIILRHGV